MSRPVLGVLAPPGLVPSAFPGFVRHVEAVGFEELWVPEDCFDSGGVAQAATALATTGLRVGLGILPAAARNVAFTAMELGFLAGAHPGRLTVGIGHGMRGWLAQAGLERPRSPLGLLGEYVAALRRLLAGDQVSVEGAYVRLDAVRLTHPPAVPPQVLVGVRGPRSLALSGRVAQGTILGEPVAPEYVVAARAEIDAGPGHEIVAYNLATVDSDPSAARALVRPALETWLSDPSWAPHLSPLPFADELDAARRASTSVPELVRRLPDAWVDALALVGTAHRVRARVEELGAAGADRVILAPVGPDPVRAVSELAALLT